MLFIAQIFIFWPINFTVSLAGDPRRAILFINNNIGARCVTVPSRASSIMLLARSARCATVPRRAARDELTSSINNNIILLEIYNRDLAE